MTRDTRRERTKLPGNSYRRRTQPPRTEPATPPPAGAAASNVEKIAQLEAEQLHRRSFFEWMGDRAVAIVGSGWVALFHLLWFLGWILVNTGRVPGVEPFDPYPFNFLTMIVSLEAIFITLAVLNNQNRMTRQADKRAHLDLQVNLLAEQESTATLRLLQRVAEKLGVSPEELHQVEALTEETDVAEILTKLDGTLPEPEAAPEPGAAAPTSAGTRLTGDKTRG
jgi:uncharacterized membrane protein